MARKVSVTVAERLAIETAIRALGGEPCLTDRIRVKTQSDLVGLLAKLTAPVEPKEPGLSLVTVERALEGCRKYAKWIAGSPGVHLKRLQQAGATPEQVRDVGLWLDTQPWMRGKYTLGSLAQKWGEWLAQVKATDSGPGGLGALFDRPAPLGG